MYGARMELDDRLKVRDGQRYVYGRSFSGDRYSEILMIEPHGFASEPVKGGQGLLLSPNGIPEEAYFFGGAKPGLRPILPAGGKAIYDAAGNIVKCIGSGIVIDAASRTIDLISGTWTIKGNGTITGNLHVNGNITCSGTITDSDGNNGA